MTKRFLNSIFTFLFFISGFGLFPFNTLAQGTRPIESCPMCGIMGGAGLFLAFVLGILILGFVFVVAAFVFDKFRHSSS